MIAWSETELAIQQAVRQFVDTEIRPVREELEFGELPPYDILRKLFKTFGIDVLASDALQAMLAKEAGRDAGDTDGSGESTGGSGGMLGASGQHGMAMLLVKEIARASLGTVAAMGVSLGLGVATIMSRGTLAQKQRWLPKLVTMEHVAAWALTEPGSGSDAFGAMRTTARRDGEGYRLNGQKTFITNGPYADVVVVYAKLDDPGTPPDKRQILTFVLDTGMAGFTQGKPLRKMGLHSSPTGELFFDDVYLEPDRLLGHAADGSGGESPAAEGAVGAGGKDSAKAGFVSERVGVAVMSLGVIEECLELCVRYAKERVQFGRPIGEYQLIQAKLAEMEIARINVQGMVFRAIEMLRKGQLPTLAEASAMKLYSSRTATDVAMEAIQLFGGNGYMAEYPLEQMARDAKSLMIYAGSNEIQTTHIAKGLLQD
ncbi:MAG: hypothetical protein QOH89_1960 [Pseudonocardiales bacterium]|nr:hypothetical protein [Pseudonocardiales bacterium]